MDFRSAVLMLLLSAVAVLSSPHGGGDSSGVVGARKLAQAQDCRGVVAFSGVSARPAVRVSNATSEEEAAHAALGTKLGFHDLLTDKSVGWSRESGEFTAICPGLFQFAFSGTGARFTLFRKEAHSAGEATTAGEWKAVASTSDAGGSHVVLLEMDVGDAVAVWMAPGGQLPSEKDAPTTSFSGYRIAKK
ncbi:uncharacterized protein LOC124168087 [Ischnura elegans]|uniref:uncharacterized protein LOC124168087 n=1 Tax=Ischnura elegans TaxID=197161 RepID=UPI001ED8803E|nr:uncharacterized protein LOC124168087 [Ischnura elegans]